ncbi:MAG: hypothetical protein ACJ75T_08935 [Solirubrobacterales bacterium]
MPRGVVPTVAELEARIDEAVVIARASEEGVREVGEIALDAAKQAKRAAEMAESASAAAEAASKAGGAARAGAGGPAGPVSDSWLSLPGESSESSPPPGSSAGREPAQAREVVIDPLRRFNERADAIAARLKKLERIPV